jgi:hypothetical protein
VKDEVIMPADGHYDLKLAAAGTMTSGQEVPSMEIIEMSTWP